jgi:hypothetical protein
MKERFIQLINDFCSLCGMSEPTHILNGGSVSINGVLVLLRQVEKLDPARLYIRCDFGEIPLHREKDACKTLLEANLDLYDGSGPAFSISPKSGHVLFSHSYLLEELSPVQLRDALSALVESALEWRKTHFLVAPRSHQGRRLPQARMPIKVTHKG